MFHRVFSMPRGGRQAFSRRPSANRCLVQMARSPPGHGRRERFTAAESHRDNLSYWRGTGKLRGTDFKKSGRMPWRFGGGMFGRPAWPFPLWSWERRGGRRRRILSMATATTQIVNLSWSVRRIHGVPVEEFQDLGGGPFEQGIANW